MVTVAAEPIPPVFCARPYLASATWRLSALFLIWSAISAIWATPVAPIGWPLAFSPPEVLIAILPPILHWPSRTAFPASPAGKKPRSCSAIMPDTV